MDTADDWTLAGMLSRKLAANGGKPLSATQEAKVKAAYDEITATQKAYDDYVAKVEAKRSDQAFDEWLERTNEEIRRRNTASVNPSDPAYGSKNKLVTKSEYEQIVKRLASNTCLPDRNYQGYKKRPAKKSLMEKFSSWIKRWS